MPLSQDQSNFLSHLGMTYPHFTGDVAAAIRAFHIFYDHLVKELKQLPDFKNNIITDAEFSQVFSAVATSFADSYLLEQINDYRSVQARKTIRLVTSDDTE